ncbi:YafY family protein [Microbacterium sp. C7(2022)]|uniref:helix-turn-helix transcriptional regulator n=1 Tax=Microbacterium sp. C7(2022) TaxID=2992759 RepID=UPI00237AD717|nr:WYL domain-containing protein [Microbacterium sp. C7(2022)]MDE0545597.1 WYL domain-containing protein [Microbacterium sp. C7(2022)]
MATDHGLTKDAILSSVSGYRELGEAGASKAALEKSFERDKLNLRQLGVPIETLGDTADPEDLRSARYRIAIGEYSLPDDIEFTPAETALLHLAGSVWGEGSMTDAARSGLRKIRALGNEVDEPIIGFAPRISMREPSFAPIERAIDQCRSVNFAYLKPGERTPRVRRVEPLALVEYEARWHVFGFDRDAGAERTFLLSRIVGDVTITRQSYARDKRKDAGERALAGLRDVASRNIAHLEVNPGTEASLRLARRALPADQGLRAPFVDAHIFADELASYGPEVRVVEPADLRDKVIERLQGALRAHEEPS